MTQDEEPGFSKINWPFAVGASLLFHAVLLGAICLFSSSGENTSRPSGGDATNQPPPQATATPEPEQEKAEVAETPKTPPKAKPKPQKAKPAQQPKAKPAPEQPKPEQPTTPTETTKPQTAATDADDNGIENYTVRPGDSLNKIAKRRGCTVHDLAKLNGIPPTKMLNVGEVLKVPAE
jgi:LysM repeat protein